MLRPPNSPKRAPPPVPTSLHVKLAQTRAPYLQLFSPHSSATLAGPKPCVILSDPTDPTALTDQVPPRKKSSTPKPSPPPRKKRWGRRLLIAGLLLLILGALANGPGARWLIHRVIRSEVAKLGLHGDLVVKGSLHTGFSLQDGKFADSNSEARIEFTELAIEYQFWELLQKKIRRIEGRNLRIITVAKPKPAKDPEEGFTLPDFDAIGETIRSFRALARPITIDIEQVQYQLLRPEGEPLNVQLGTLLHPAHSDAYTLTAFSSNALGEKGLPEQDFELRWGEKELVLNQLTIFPDLALSGTRVGYEPENPVELFATATALSSRLVLFADSAGTIEIDLNNDSLDLAASVARFAPDLALTGQIPHLHLRADHLLDKPAEWELLLNLKANELAWKNGPIGNLGADLVLADRANLIADLGDGLKARLDAENPLRKSSPTENPDWWKDINGTADFELPSIHQTLQRVFTALGKDVPDLASIPDGKFALQGDFRTGGPLHVQIPNSTWTLQNPVLDGRPLPDLKGTASLQDSKAGLTLALAAPRENESLTLEGTYDLNAKTYTGKLDVNLPDTEPLQPFLSGDSPDWKPTDAMAFTWSGQGSLPDNTHQGSAEITNLTVNSPAGAEKSSLNLHATYQWPDQVALPSLSIKNGDLSLAGAAIWKDQRLDVASLQLNDANGPLLTVKGALPLTTDALSIDEILASEDPIDLSIEASELKLQRLRELLPLNLPPEIAATLNGSLKFGGTPAHPTLNGSLTGTGITFPADLPTFDTKLLLSTTDGILLLDGTINETQGRVVTIAGKLPLTSEQWIRNPESLRAVPLDLTASINQFALPRLQALVPILAKAEGTFTTEFHLTGTPAEPNINGTANIDLKRFPLANTPYRNVRDANIRLRLEGKRIIVEPSSALVSGGKFTLGGEVGIDGKEPLLDLRLTADHALLWRNDSFVLRTNSNLSLTGPWKTARLSGSLSLVESLYYKDIEIIPIGVPTTSAPKPKLPTIDQAKVSKAYDIPAPFDAWTLDLTLKTADPILIRGNVATGEITADVRIDGTLAVPRPSGSFLIKKAVADLPFSKLTVKNASVILQPDAPLDPILDIRGTSTVNSQRVNLYLYGPLSNPKYTLSSDRGLPENEILTLLATGTTTSDLEDPEVAKSKAFQIFIDDLRRRANKPGGNRTFRSIMNELDQVDLKVGENDPFSGRKFNSATLQIADQWYLSASVDGLGNTRGLVIFSMRFR